MLALLVLEGVHLLQDEVDELLVGHLVGQLGVLLPLEGSVLDARLVRLEHEHGAL